MYRRYVAPTVESSVDGYQVRATNATAL